MKKKSIKKNFIDFDGKKIRVDTKIKKDGNVKGHSHLIVYVNGKDIGYLHISDSRLKLPFATFHSREGE